MTTGSAINRHDLSQRWVAANLHILGAAFPFPGCFIGFRGPVASLAAIAQEFTADGGCCKFQPTGYAADVFTGGQAARYLLALSQRQGQARSVSCRRPDAARCTQGGVNGGVRSVKQLADLVQGIASFPATPHQGFLRFDVVNPHSLRPASTPSDRGGHCVASTD